MPVNVAAVQPRSWTESEELRNVEESKRWLRSAAAAGADLVVFPEGYPGPANPRNRYDAITPLAELAGELGVHIIASRIEPAPQGGHYMCLYLIDDGGHTLGIYRRTTPQGPYIYKDISAWGFDYMSSEEAPQVYETRLGRIGMLVCSEVFVPELSRVLALKGADIIAFPSGGAINELMSSWKTMVWARAIENLVFTIAVQNLYTEGEEGVGMIAAPESVLAQVAGQGLVMAELDFERLKFLREENEKVEFPKRYRTVPGLMRWRKTELYMDLLTRDSGSAHPLPAQPSPARNLPDPASGALPLTKVHTRRGQ
jgi:predicted amidohydrolase